MRNLEMEKLSLIDISSEDEFLVRSPSADGFADFRLSGSCSILLHYLP